MQKPKSKGPKPNNPFSIDNAIADEIRRLGNGDLVSKASLEYSNWVATERIKKNDSKIQDTKKLLKGLRSTIKEHPEYQKLEAEFKNKKEELITEEQASLEEELRNLSSTFNEDIKSYRGQFKIAMDEITNRKQKGLFKV